MVRSRRIAHGDTGSRMGTRATHMAGSGDRALCGVLAAAGGASSAAVTVAILAQPTRGAALAKAVNRIAATFIGATMSIVIAGLFPGERVGLLAAFILWMCVCVFVGSYFRGFRAYAAVLSGYTVGIITVV